MNAQVLTIEYDPNRNARIALVQYDDGEKRYILQPTGLKVGDNIIASTGGTKLYWKFTSTCCNAFRSTDS